MWNNNKIETKGKYLSFLALAAVTVTLLLAFPLAAASSPPPPPPIPPGSQSATWAYGRLISWNDSEISHWAANNSTSSSSFSEKGQIAVGLEVIYIQTNTSGGEMVQTYAALTVSAQVSVSAQKSDPSVSFSGSASFSADAWYVIQNYVNLTNSASVTSLNHNGSSVPAIGIINAQSYVAANATASFSAQASGSSEGSTTSLSANGYFAAAVQASAGVAFTPALGFIPLHVAPGDSWSSQSDYSASGRFAAAMHEYAIFPVAVAGFVGGGSGHCPPGFTLQGSNCVINNSESVNQSLATTGALYLFGSDEGTVTLPSTVSGQTIQAQEIEISTHGPFGFTDGVVLIPSQLAGVGGNSSAPHTPTHQLVQVMSTPSGGDDMYYAANSPSHVGFVGSNGGIIGGKTFTASPQTPQAAEQQAQTNLASTQPGKQSVAGFPIMLVLVVVIVAVVAIAFTVVWTGRRRRRAPPAGAKGQVEETPTNLPPQTPAAPGMPVPPMPPAPQPGPREEPVGFYWQSRN